METTKQSVGIDCAKKNFAVSFSVLSANGEVHHLSSREFNNDEQGFKALNKWVGKLEKKSLPLFYVMEATGVYYERLAHFLSDLGKGVCVILPNRAKNFSKTLKIKKVTDKISAQSLATMGLEKKLDLWKKPDRTFAQIKHLCREKGRIQKYIVEAKNQLEAERSGKYPNGASIKRLNNLIKILQNQAQSVLKELNQLINTNAQLKSKIQTITTIPGIGLLTAATVIGETDGFKQVKNKRQLVSYAGYDVINQESGTSIRTKPKISKRGNKHIRKAMHMPALAAIRCNQHNQELFKRIVSRTGIKMKAVVAVQRKLLVLIYTLWKNDTKYDINYEERLKAALPELD